MTKNEWKEWVGVAGRMLLAYALVFAQGAWATRNQATKDKAASPQKAAAQQAQEKQSAAATTAKAQIEQRQAEEPESAVGQEQPSRDASHQGIKVHGHWTIEVRNPDGTVATHREFENSLAPSTGGMLLASLLNTGGNKFTPPLVPFLWGVRLGAGGCQPIPSFPDGTLSSHSGSDCVIAQGGTQVSCGAATVPSLPSGPPFVPAQSCNLTTAVNSGSFVLSGTVQAAASFVITSVATETIVPVPESCDPLSPPPFNACSIPPQPSQFTSATLSQAQQVQVSAGQTIAVTVNISFS